MAHKHGLTTADAAEFEKTRNLTSEIIVNILLELREIKNFDSSFILLKPYNFNFQALNKKTALSGCGTILSFAKEGGGMFAVLNSKLEAGTNILLNLLIDKIHLNVMGAVDEVFKTKSKDIYIAHIKFKNLSKSDIDKITYLMKPRKELKTDGAEKREYLRLPKSIPITYQVYKKDKTLDENAALVYTIDISQGGLKIASAQRLSINDKIYVQMPLGGKKFYCTGKVIWVELSETDKKYLAGIKFIDLSREAKENLLELILK